MDLELDSSLTQSKSMVEQFDSSASEKKYQLLSGHPTDAFSRNLKPASSSRHGAVLHANEHGWSSSVKGAHGAMPLIKCDNKGKSVENRCSSDKPKGEFFYLEGLRIWAFFFF